MCRFNNAPGGVGRISTMFTESTPRNLHCYTFEKRATARKLYLTRVEEETIGEAWVSDELFLKNIILLSSLGLFRSFKKCSVRGKTVKFLSDINLEVTEKRAKMSLSLDFTKFMQQTCSS